MKRLALFMLITGIACVKSEQNTKAEVITYIREAFHHNGTSSFYSTPATVSWAVERERSLSVSTFLTDEEIQTVLQEEKEKLLEMVIACVKKTKILKNSLRCEDASSLDEFLRWINDTALVLTDVGLESVRLLVLPQIELAHRDALKDSIWKLQLHKVEPFCDPWGSRRERPSNPKKLMRNIFEHMEGAGRALPVDTISEEAIHEITTDAYYRQIAYILSELRLNRISYPQSLCEVGFIREYLKESGLTFQDVRTTKEELHLLANPAFARHR